MRVSFNRFATSVIPRAMLKIANPIGKVVSVSLVRLIARPMLASAYIANGVVRVKNPDVAASSVEPISKMAKKKFDVEIDPALIARATGVAQVTAGSLLAIGKMPRLSSSILVTTYLLEVVGQQLNKETRSTDGLLAKTAILGGALLASVDTAGKPGLAWRAQHAAEDLWREVERTSAKAVDAVSPN